MDRTAMNGRIEDDQRTSSLAVPETPKLEGVGDVIIMTGWYGIPKERAKRRTDNREEGGKNTERNVPSDTRRTNGSLMLFK